ncbi:MAG TPA: glycosyltransferase family 2 protein [Thermoanaerobaculia bacterium]|nr:glycosyltransferase family 2 protein [Thermoanaerobaculia bacterium]HUM29922.1 glycosyltransferase family 2 protein [Thermoanaerobaculia bacterium]HXK68211.1 glycosyltransferase family 2 protein [Thermoanaerobaculia bacterium]
MNVGPSKNRIRELSAVFPAYNESTSIEVSIHEALSALVDICVQWELIVVDDGSTDNTLEILKRLEGEHRNLRVISYTPNRGYAWALRTGFDACRYDLIFYSDADAQFDLHEIMKLYEEIDRADMVVGYRKDRKDPFIRIIYSRTYNLLQRAILGIRARDINCAFKLYRKEFLSMIPLTADHFVIDAEFFARAGIIGARVIEVPVTHHPRKLGSSTVSVKTICRTLKGMRALRKDLASWKPEN